MNDTHISDSILYIGVNDRTLDLFESQYAVPNGVTYNSYVILDEKVPIWSRHWPGSRWIIWWFPIWSRTMQRMWNVLPGSIRRLSWWAMPRHLG